jgi:hypothetical protein
MIDSLSNRRRSKVVSSEGIAHIPANRTEMAPAAARRVVELRRSRKASPLADEEQRIIDAAQWLESLTGKSKCYAPLVAALAGINCPTTVIDWFRVLDQRGAIAYEDMHIRMRKLGRKLANPPASMPTLEELHRRVVSGQWGPYARALQSLIDRYPESYTRQEFATAADIPFESFPFEHAIRSLLRQGLIKSSSAGILNAAAVLFDGPRS